MTVQLDLQQLRETAEKATPGRWSETYAQSRTIEAEDGAIVVDALNDGIGAGVVNPEDAEHITTFDPPTVLALLDRLEQAEKVIAEALALCPGPRSWADDLQRDFSGKPFARLVDGDAIKALLSAYQEHTTNHEVGGHRG